MATQQDFADWRRHPVTQEVIQYLEEKNQEAVNRLVTEKCHTLEESGMLHLAVQNYLSGLGEFLDLDYLQEVLSDVIPD